jgi:hypothetical protein
MSQRSLKLPIWGTAVAGYRDGIGALLRDGKLFRYFIYASALMVVLSAGQLYVELGGSLIPGAEKFAPGIGNLLFGLLIAVAYAIAASPLTVALHRKFLLGETPPGAYFAAIFRGAEARVAAATMAVYALFFVAQLTAYPLIYVAYGVNPLNAADVGIAYALEPTIALIVVPLTWSASLLAGLMSTRLAFAFPGIAINAPGASLRQSYAETRGSAWRLFFIFLLILLLPFLAFVIAIGAASVSVIVGNPEAVGDPDRAAEMMMVSTPFLVAYAVGVVLMMAVVVAIGAAAARAYDVKVNRGLTGVAEVFA